MKLLQTFAILLSLSTTLMSQISDVKLACHYDESSDRYTVSMHVLSGASNNQVYNTQAASQISVVIPVAATLQMIESYNPSHSNGNASSWTGFNIFEGTEDIPMKIVGMIPTISPVAMYDGLAEGDVVELFSFSVSEGEGCRIGARLYENGIDPSAEVLNGAEFSNSMTIGTLTPLYSGNLYQSLDRDGGNICANTQYQLPTDEDLVYESSDSAIAAVSNSGLLETYAQGSVTIQIKSASENCTVKELFYQVLSESDPACLASATHQKSMNLTVYPIPATDWLTIRDGAELSNISVRDVKGQKYPDIKKQAVGRDLLLQVANLPSGVYFLSVETGAGINSQRIAVTQ